MSVVAVAAGLAAALSAGAGASPTAARNPVVARTVLLRRVSGVVRVAAPHHGFTGLTGSTIVPVGSTVDVTHGKVALTAAADLHGHTQTASFYGGAFMVGQRRAAHPVTNLRLTGGGVCAPAKDAHEASHRPRRHLWGSGKGSFSTSGSSASASVRGTTWLTEDFCDGTDVSVAQGVVAVHDLVRHVTTNIPADDGYFSAAKPGGAVIETPPTVSARSEPVGTTDPGTFLAIRNVGTAAFRFSTPGYAIGGPNATDFRVDVDSCSGDNPAPGASCQIGVHFQPTATGLRRATLHLRDTATSGAQDIPLSGTGT
jgi:hypothetical protein